MRLLLKLIAGLLGLTVAALACLMVYLSVFFDPNEYKGLIIEKAKAQNVDLKIDGDIGWSVFPWLGLELGQTSVAPPGQEPLASIQAVQVGVKLVPLLGGQVQMSGILLDGLKTRLSVDEQGNGNWMALGPQQQDSSTETEKEAPAQGSDQGGGLPDIDIASLEIRDASINYSDAQAGQSVELAGFNLKGQQVRLAEFFPLQVSFSVAVGEPQLDVTAEIEAEVYADPEQQDFRVQNLAMDSTLAGEPFAGKTVPLSMSGGMSAKLKEQSATISGLILELANLKAEVQAGVTSLDTAPVIDGRLNVAPFSVSKLLDALGQPAIETSDASALQQVGLNTLIKSNGDVYTFDGLTLKLDDTSISGNARVNAATQASFFRLKADAIDVDRYLPPVAEEAQEQSGGTSTQAATAEADLIPVETLRGLDIDGEFTLGSLKASGLTVSDIVIKLLARGGVVDLRQLTGKLYQGTFASTAKVNVRGKTPILHITEKVSSVQLGPLLQDLAGEQRASGTFNLDATFDTQGNRQKVLMQNLGGQAGFNLTDGAVEGYNLNRQVCSGLARLNKTDLPAQQWGTSTPIDQASGNIRFVNGKGSNNDLVIKAAGTQVAGKGTIDLPAEQLDYSADVAIVGRQMGEGVNACQVPEKYQNVKIPLRCKGQFQDPPGKMCGLDFAGLLKGEAKRRINEKIEEKLGDKLGDEGKQLLKGLFGR